MSDTSKPLSPEELEAIRERTAWCGYCDTMVPESDIGADARHKACGWKVHRMPPRQQASYTDCVEIAKFVLGVR